mgnify:CR=1 FL=1
MRFERRPTASLRRFRVPSFALRTPLFARRPRGGGGIAGRKSQERFDEFERFEKRRVPKRSYETNTVPIRRQTLPAARTRRAHQRDSEARKPLGRAGHIMLTPTDIDFLTHSLTFWDNLKPIEQQLILDYTMPLTYKQGTTIHGGNRDCIGVQTWIRCAGGRAP